MGHILHRLDNLTDVIWVILSKKIYITLVVSKNRCNIIFYPILKFALLIRTQFHSVTSLSRLRRQMCVMYRGYQYMGTLCLIYTL